MAINGKAALVVLDGFGLEPRVEWEIVSTVWARLSERLREVVSSAVGGGDRAQAALAPTSHGVARWLSDRDGAEWLPLFQAVAADRKALQAALEEAGLAGELLELRQAVARDASYAPWAANTPFLNELRQENPTWITRTAGVFTGHVAMEPEIMGNSDTGHQQIFNLMVARQIPAAIGVMIDNGEFFANEELNRDLRLALEGRTVVFKTLLSGEHGDDGFVHSAWPHMEAFLKLYFEVLHLPARRLQIEAVLDGRDSPFYSSMRYEEKDGLFRYGFLRKLRRLLAKYNAEQSLAWIIGRQFMDRDYKGGMIRKEYEMLTANKGRAANCIDRAFELVEQDHAAGHTDPMVEPIVVGNPVPVGNETVYFNAIFRADRQEPITAALLGDREFIRKQAEQKKRLDTWGDFSWIRQFDGLRMWSMITYHSDFSARGARSIYQDSPHPHNVLHLLNESEPEFRFLFLTEGVKEKHMGLFSRGRRSTPLLPAETQHIISTYGKEAGIESDNDLYKVPMMRHPEIADALCHELATGTYDLVAVNFPGADMIGHLIGNHFEACIETLRSLERAVKRFVPLAREKGWLLVLTADHGNIEHPGPDHGNNDVLTTVLLPADGHLVSQPPAHGQARLFDISWTLLEGLGVDPDSLAVPEFPEHVVRDPNRLIGSSLVKQK